MRAPFAPSFALPLAVAGCHAATVARAPAPAPSAAVAVATSAPREEVAPRVAPPPPCASSPVPAPLDLPPARPTEVSVEPAGASVADECIDLDAVQPEGRPLTVCLARTPSLVFRYDDAGRVVSAAGARYAYTRGAATRTCDGRATQVAFDAAGRLVRDGAERRRFDAAGRLVREESGGRFLAYVYAPDGTYTTRHNHPDTDEFCVADRVEVLRDARGRVALERYEGCAINEIARTLRYAYGEGDRLESVEIDLGSDGTLDATLRLRYAR